MDQVIFDLSIILLFEIILFFLTESWNIFNYVLFYI